MSRVTLRFFRSMKGIDRFMKRFVSTTLALLFIAQALLLSPAIRRTLNIAERLEGQSIQVARRISPEPEKPGPVVKGRITVALEGSQNKNAVLLVNGEEVGDFGEKTLSFDVRSGDLIEIDGGTRPVKLTFRVTDATSGVVEPRVGQIIETKGTIEIVARVKVR